MTTEPVEKLDLSITLPRVLTLFALLLWGMMVQRECHLRQVRTWALQFHQHQILAQLTEATMAFRVLPTTDRDWMMMMIMSGMN